MKLRSLLKRETKPQKQNKVLAKLRNKVVIQAVIAAQSLIVAVALIFGMSAAWYNNVLQTSGLQFQAEAWGFSGQVQIYSTPVEAAPGDSGVVSIVIDNTGGDLLDATVCVTKDDMAEEMRKRLFFYVDDGMIRNGEALERVYVSGVSGYTYTVLENSTLSMTDEQANGAPLQWQWVYDMLGYYFLGTVADGSAAAEEYLRPVEYDLDSATFDEDGKLETVDGETTTEEFLAQLAATDGYVDATDADGNVVPLTESEAYPGYYPVSVDENGYGVWIYLCNLEDIEEATQYDTQLGKTAADETAEQPLFEAKITLIGQQSSLRYFSVSTAEELKTALELGVVPQLEQDLTLSETLSFTALKDAVLDLNGNTIYGPDDAPALRLLEGSDLLLMNGTVSGGSSASDVVKVNNSQLVMSNVTIEGSGHHGVNVVDRGAEGDSFVRLVNCKVDASTCAIYMCGNGTESESVTKVMLEGCTLTSDYIAVSGNGNSTSWGTELQITDSALTGLYAALYQPQSDSITTVRNSKLSGITGAAIKAGTLVVEDSEFYGTGTTDQIDDPTYSYSGFTDTGDALYIEDGYSREIVVRISGEKTVMSSANAKAVRVFAENSEYVDIQITGGAYSSDVTAFLAEGYRYADGVVSKEGS